MLGLEKAISEGYIGSTGPCGNKKKAEIFNFPQINVRLQVILGGGRLVGPGRYSARIARNGKQILFHTPSITAARGGGTVSINRLSVRPSVSPLPDRFSFVFPPISCFSLRRRCLCCFRKETRLRAMRR